MARDPDLECPRPRCAARELHDAYPHPHDVDALDHANVVVRHFDHVVLLPRAREIRHQRVTCGVHGADCPCRAQPVWLADDADHGEHVHDETLVFLTHDLGEQRSDGIITCFTKCDRMIVSGSRILQVALQKSVEQLTSIAIVVRELCAHLDASFHMSKGERDAKTQTIYAGLHGLLVVPHYHSIIITPWTCKWSFRGFFPTSCSDTSYPRPDQDGHTSRYNPHHMSSVPPSIPCSIPHISDSKGVTHDSVLKNCLSEIEARHTCPLSQIQNPLQPQPQNLMHCNRTSSSSLSRTPMEQQPEKPNGEEASPDSESPTLCLSDPSLSG